MDLGLKDKVVMVAASSKGLGYGIARQAALEGAKLSLGSRYENNIRAAAEKLKNEVPGIHVHASILNVADPVSIESWVSSTLKEFGTIDKLVVNGGGPPPGTFDEIDDLTWHTVLPVMRRNRTGSIVTVTSSSVKEPIDSLLLSNVFRAGVTSLVKSLSFQVAKDQIRINNLVPGFFDTDRLQELDQRNSREWRISIENVRKINFDKIPMGRYGDPDEFGKAAVYLLSDAASYVTGETFIIDGGKMRTVW